MIFKNRQHHISTLILFTILILTNHQNGQHGHSNEHEHDYDRGPGWGPQDHRLLPSDGWAENFLYLFRKLKPPFIDFIYCKIHISSSCIQNFIYLFLTWLDGQVNCIQSLRPWPIPWSTASTSTLICPRLCWGGWQHIVITMNRFLLWLQKEWRLVITKIFPQSRTEP